ncbi:MAG: hypothetical protein M0P31_19180 [Solirubrobacteraceae bacterium]|nr:hypothetical protein [Solirubrobacteraceae bacterium]
MSLRLADHPRLLWALSAQRPVRESVPILARQAFAVARRHPAGVELLTVAIAGVLTCLSVATAARTTLDTLRETTR